MLAALLSIPLLSYPLGMSGIKAPAPMNQFATEFEFQHRFYGDILDESSTFLGMDQGANANLGLGFYPIKGLGLHVARISRYKEFNVGLSYSHAFRRIFLNARLGADWINAEVPGAERTNEFSAYISLDTEPILGRITPYLMGAYFDEDIFLGAALSLVLLKDVGYFEEIALFGEFYPAFERVHIPEDEPRSGYVAGIGVSTYGHQFLLTVSNSTSLGYHHLRGVTRYFEDEDTYLHLGFTIRRLLARGKES
jgi:hypothetical protein